MIGALLRAVRGRRIGVYHGVAVRDRGWLDGVDHEPEHKAALSNAVINVVEPGDQVVMVGGGRGVAAVHGARAGGDVVVYEAAREMVDLLEETARLNGVVLDVRHGVVGELGDAYGDADMAPKVPPEALYGDVLVLDCEGAEESILPEVSGFRRVIVESHPEFGVTTGWVEKTTGGRAVAPDPIDGDVVVA